MTDETLNWIVALGVIIGLIVNVVSYFLTRKETRALQVRTGRIERELHRLSVGLDQNIQRLHRARDALMQVEMIVAKSHMQGELEAHGLSHELDRGVLLDDISTFKTNVSLLRGLIIAIDDSTLSSMIGQLSTAFTASDDLRDIKTNYPHFNKLVTDMHARIAFLIEDATSDKK